MGGSTVVIAPPDGDMAQYLTASRSPGPRSPDRRHRPWARPDPRRTPDPRSRRCWPPSRPRARRPRRFKPAWAGDGGRARRGRLPRRGPRPATRSHADRCGPISASSATKGRPAPNNPEDIEATWSGAGPLKWDRLRRRQVRAPGLDYRSRSRALQPVISTSGAISVATRSARAAKTSASFPSLRERHRHALLARRRRARRPAAPSRPVARRSRRRGADRRLHRRSRASRRART